MTEEAVDLTVVIVQRDDQVLLGRKKTGFGAGRWNGFGGKIESGETITQAARRELAEEAGLVAVDCVQHGILHASFTDDADLDGLSSAAAAISRRLRVHLFRVTTFSGTPTESREMTPAWFSIADIPYSKMWPDDRHWLPLLLRGLFFELEATFDADHNLLEHRLKKLAEPAPAWHTK